MAIFSKNKQEEKETTDNKAGKEEKKTTPVASRTVFVSGGVAIEDVLRRPHITEKASALAEKNVYVFEVDPKANKAMVKNAVRLLYKVTPEKVRIVNVPRKRVFIRGIRGVKPGMKKALVYLKKGESIEII